MLNDKLRRWFGSGWKSSAAGKQRKRQRPGRARRPMPRLWAEQLEERVVLSSASMSFPMTGSASMTQFSNASLNTFLGGSFNTSTTFDSIDSTAIGDFGAQATLSLAGRAGLNINFSGNGGNVSSTYSATLNQSFDQPTAFGQVVSFNPQNTNVNVNSGSVATTTPSFGYGADLVASLSGSVGGKLAFFGTTSGSYPFNQSLDLPLFAVNENDSGLVQVLGVPILGASPGTGLSKELSQFGGAIQNFIAAKSLYFGISNDPPLRVKLNFNTPGNLQFNQDLQLQLGLPKQLGPYTVPSILQNFIPNVAIDLGSITEQAPTIALSSSSLQAGGVVSASSSSPIAQISIPMGPLAGYLLGIPALAVLGDTDSINVGPFNVQFTPINFQLQPTLAAAQTVSIQPVSMLTYNFANSNGTAITPDVILDGADLGNRSSVTFIPGQDTVGVRFKGAPIVVTPTWDFKEVLTNEVDLQASLDANLTIGLVTANIPGVGSFTAGPLYQQNFNFANANIGTLLKQTSTLFEQSTTLTQDKFTIGSGGSFQLDTTVTRFDDPDPAVAGSLRFAVLSANVLSQMSGTGTAIQLGAGTYQLTIGPDSSQGEGESGNLLIGGNILIQGAGPGQTIIQANFPAGDSDRLFHIMPGGSLTLDGVTLKDGNPANSLSDPGLGGAIFQDSGNTPGTPDPQDGSALDLENSVVKNNQAVQGGGIYVNSVTTYDLLSVSGTPLTINNSTISNNTATGGASLFGQAGGAGLGGGVYVNLIGTASQAIIENSTFSGNEAIGGRGGDGVPFSSVAAGGAGGNGEGGGLYVKQTVFNSNGTIVGNNFTLSNDTFTGNSALGGAGGKGANEIFTSAAGSGGNGGDGLGGAVRVFEVANATVGKTYPFELLNDTIASNSTSGGQGGLAGSHTLLGAAQNGSAGHGKGGGAYEEPTFSLIAQNTILANNTADVGPDMDGGLTSAGKNLIRNTSGATISAATGAGADLTNVDPQLGPLASNGGPTQTMAIAPGSPAIDAGSGTMNTATASIITVSLPTTDQRGFSRVSNGHVDIGAFQYQYDLAVTGAEVFSSSLVKYSFTVTNNGPDAVSGVTLTDPVPAHNSGFVGLTNGWTEKTATNGTVTFTDNTPLAAGQSATFQIFSGLTLSPPTVITNTATVGPATYDVNAGNNTVKLSLLDPTEGQSLQNALLYYFPSPGAGFSAANFTASVTWGDGSPANTSIDGTGTVSVVADGGGFDVLGSHTYGDEGNHTVTVHVTDLLGATVTANFANGTSLQQNLPAPLPTFGALPTTVLYHFVDPNASSAASFSFPFAFWGDNTLGEPPMVSVVADPAGGFDFVGSHSFASNVLGAVNFAQVFDSASSVFSGPSLLHFSGATPTSADHFTVVWGDGNTTTTSGILTGNNGGGIIRVFANPAGGFDLVGQHLYTQGLGTFSGTALVVAADADLTSGALTPPRVVAGDKVSNFVLYGFTDANPQATKSDYTATVNWGDGTSNTSADGSGSVSLAADPLGGFDVLITHTFATAFANGTLSVEIDDKGGASTSASSSFSVDYALTAGTLTTPAVTTEGDSIQNATLFHFTDSDPSPSLSDFSANVAWGDGSSDTSDDGNVTITANANGGFDVSGSHTFGETLPKSFFAVIVNDAGGATIGAQNTSFTVSDPSPSVTGGFSLTANENADPGLQTVATFTDPGGAEALSDYAATVHWADGMPDSSGVITYNKTTSVFTVQADHVYAQDGSYQISVTISHHSATTGTVTDTATVSDIAVTPAGSITLSTVYGQSTGNQMVATFTDAGGVRAPSDYQPAINWGDTTSSAGVVGFDTAAPFTFASNLPTGNGPADALVADLNGDGNLDLVVANATDHAVQVFLGNGDGTFQSPTSYSLGAASPTALAIADLDGDGKLDIVTANSNNNTLSVLINQGGGAFLLTKTLHAGVSPSAVAVADLGNGHLDIVSANSGSNNISVFLGNGSGAFGSATNFAAGTSPVSLAIGDLDGDHKNDIVVADHTTQVAPDGHGGLNVFGQVSILLGKGDGTFQTPTTVAVGDGAASVALANLNNDSKLDLVTANEISNNVSVLLGKGDGTFQTAVNYAVGTAPVAVLVIASGATESIVTANAGSNNVSVLTGNGDGTFQAATNYALATGAKTPVSIAAGDLDGAGVLDLVTANSTTNNVTLLLPPFAVTGSHTFSSTSGTTPFSIGVNVDHEDTSTSATTGSAKVTPAPLTITANNLTIMYGQTPGFTVTPMGLVNGDTLASLGGALTIGGDAATAVHAGSYAIVPGGLTSGNYTIMFVNGTLMIDAATLTITADNQSRAYGDPNPTLTVSYLGFVNKDDATSLTGTLSVTTTATQSSPVGPYTITAIGLSSNDYTISYQPGTLTINQAVLTVTANDASRIYGIANPAFGVSYKGFKNNEMLSTSGVTGQPTLSTLATASSAPGNYAIHPSRGTLSAGNYSFAFVDGTLTIAAAPLSATAVNFSATAGAPFSGVVATFTNADPFGNAMSYTATIQWGDGSMSTGTISANSSGGLSVTGTHTYAGASTYGVVVQISHRLGYTTTATVRPTATVIGLGTSVSTGQSAGIGFWQNSNGQTLIKSFSGGSSSTVLGNWLATTFPNLYGAGAASHNLTGKNNAQVAAFYLTLFTPLGPQLDAQVLATALNVYATTLSLGGAAASAYHFKVTAAGLGAASFNVGANGAAFGVKNNTSLNVYQILLAANQQAVNGVLYNGNATLRSLAANVFNGINSAGGI